MLVASLMIGPDEAHYMHYSTIKLFGTCSRPARARVSGAMTTRLRKARPCKLQGESKCREDDVALAVFMMS